MSDDGGPAMTRPTAQLDRLREAEALATKGPWGAAGGYLTNRNPEGHSFSSTIYHLDELGQEGGPSPFQAVPFAKAGDAAFIATSRNDLPAVLDYVAELEAREARYRIALADAIRRPLGVVPDSVGDMGDLIAQTDIDQAEDRRPRT